MSTRIVVNTALYDALNPEGDATIVLLAPWGEVYGKYRVNLHTRLTELETLLRDSHEFAPGRLLFIANGKLLPSHATFSFVGVHHEDVFTMCFVIDSTEHRQMEFVGDVTVLIKETDASVPPDRFSVPPLTELEEVMRAFNFRNGTDREFSFFYQGMRVTGKQTPYQFNICEPGSLMIIDAFSYTPRSPPPPSEEHALTMIDMGNENNPRLEREGSPESIENNSDTELLGHEKDTPESPVSPVMETTQLSTATEDTSQDLQEETTMQEPRAVPQFMAVLVRQPTPDPPSSFRAMTPMKTRRSTMASAEVDSEGSEDSDDDMGGSTLVDDEDYVDPSRHKRLKKPSKKSASKKSATQTSSEKDDTLGSDTVGSGRKLTRENIAKIVSHRRYGRGYSFTVETLLFKEQIARVNRQQLKRLKPQMLQEYVEKHNLTWH